jgi:hypothetical protein
MRDDVNKRLCELLGIKDYDEWIEKPDFFSPAGRIDLLQRLKEKGCVYEFLARFAFPADFVSFLLDDNGALARAALEFMEGKEANHE